MRWPWRFDAEQFRAIFWVPVGEFSTAAQASIGMLRISAQSREGELADSREVAGGVALSDTTVVCAESHVKHPVHQGHRTRTTYPNSMFDLANAAETLLRSRDYSYVL